MSSMDQKFTNNSVKKCRTVGDAGQVRCSSGWMQNRWDAGVEGQEGCRTGGMLTIGMQHMRDVDRSDAGQEGLQDRKGCRTGRDAGQVGCGTGEKQDRRDEE